MRENRLKQYINDDLIFSHVIQCYKALLKEGDKDKIMYFKSLIIGCVKRNFFDSNNGTYIPIKRFLYLDHHNFLSYVNSSYTRYLSYKRKSMKHIIYGYHTNELQKIIL